jgi:hypothetical protein
METKTRAIAGNINKIQTNFRLNENLVSALKQKARDENRSLTNYVSVVLSQAVLNQPNITNAETLQAIEDVRQGKVMPMGNVDDFFAKILNDEI